MIYLDPSSTVVPDDSLRTVETEVEFLLSVLCQRPLLVRGTVLCRWAELLCDARGMGFETVLSNAHRIRDASRGQLSLTQAESIAAKLQSKESLPSSLNLTDVARALWGGAWWAKSPSPTHAAQWLVWRVSVDLTDEEEHLLRLLGQSYGDCSNESWSEAYASASKDGAEALLLAWLRLPQTRFDGEGFPDVVELSDSARSLLNVGLRRAVRSVGVGALINLYTTPGVSSVTLSAAAGIIADHAIRNTGVATSELLVTLEPWLDIPTAKRLRDHVAPPAPLPVPSSPFDLHGWFESSYLPYRLWPSHDEEVIKRTAGDFARLLLPAYVDAVAGSSMRAMLSWMKARQLGEPGFATIMVVLDGLSYPDMVFFWNQWRALDRDGRLTLILRDTAFASIPTITECCKPALQAGVSPRVSKTSKPLGVVCTKDDDAIAAARGLAHGEMIVLSLSEPDRSYHQHRQPHVANTMAQGALMGVVQRVDRIVQEVPTAVRLRLVVTTDHGRLLADSPRVVGVPTGMRSHQRAALGGGDRHYPTDGFFFQDDLVYLDPIRFALSEPAAIILNGDSFRMNDDRGGLDAYPHGGIYPEEVIIPWWVIERDAVLRAPEVEIFGTGVAGRRATMKVRVLNVAPVPIAIHRLIVSWAEEPIPLSVKVQPEEDRVLDLDITWPSSEQLTTGDATVEYTFQGRDATATRVGQTGLTSQSLFESDDDILKEL